jgi:hypothetical protein
LYRASSNAAGVERASAVGISTSCRRNSSTDLFDHSEVKALQKRLKPLQEDFGHVNDVRTAHTLTEEVSRHVNEGGNEISRAGGIVLGWHGRGPIAREPKLRKSVKRRRRAKPFWRRGDLPLAALAAPADAAPRYSTSSIL